MASNIDIATLTAKLALDAKQFNAGIDTATQKLGTITKGNAWSKVGDSLNSIAKGATVMGGAIVGAAGLATKSAVDFESAFTGVKKTVDVPGTQQEIDGFFKNLREGILELSRKMPVAATEIAGVVEAAGQLGIHNESLLGFTEVMIGLGSATNLSSQEAAVSLAQFANVTQMSQKDFDRLGSSIVELGNNMATDERQIVDFATELAVLGQSAGFSEADILALGASMASLGLESAASGTAMQRLSMDMIDAVSDMNESYAGFQYTTDMTFDTFIKGWDDAGTSLDMFAYVSGMSAEQFAKAWKEDAMGAFMEFIKGLGSRETAEQLTIFDRLDIKQMREIDMLQRLAGNTQLVEEAVRMSNNAWNENAALNTEVAKRNEDTASQLQMVKNMASEVAIEAGTALLPIVKELLTQAKPLLDRVTQYLKENPDTVVRITKVGAALLTIGTAVSGVIKVVTAISSFVTIIKTLGSAIGVLTGGGAVAGAAGAAAGGGGLLAGLGAAIGAIAPVVLAVGAVVGAFALAWQTDWLNCQEHMSAAVEAFKQKKEETGSTLQALSAAVKTFTNGIAGEVSAWWQGTVVPWFESTFGFIGEWFGNLFSSIGEWFNNVVTSVVTWLTNAWNTVQQWATNALNLLQTVFDLINQGVTKFYTWITETASKIWSEIQNWFGQVISFVTAKASAFFSDAKSKIDSAWSWVKQKGSEMLSNVKQRFTEIFSTVKEKMSEILNNVKERLTELSNNVKEKITELSNNVREKMTEIRSFLSEKMSEIKNFITEHVTSIWRTATEKMASMKQDVVTKMTDIKNTVIEKMTAVTSTVKEKVTTMASEFRSKISTFADDAREAFSRVYDAISEKIHAAASAVSDAVGSMKDKIRSVLDAVSDAWSRVRDFASNAWNNVSSYFGGWYASGGPISSGKAYMVGEEGPELFVPRTDGYIVNNDDTMDLLGGGDQTINIYIQGDVYDDQVSMKKKLKGAMLEVIREQVAYG